MRSGRGRFSGQDCQLDTACPLRRAATARRTAALSERLPPILGAANVCFPPILLKNSDVGLGGRTFPTHRPIS